MTCTAYPRCDCPLPTECARIGDWQSTVSTIRDAQRRLRDRGNPAPEPYEVALEMKRIEVQREADRRGL